MNLGTITKAVLIAAVIIIAVRGGLPALAPLVRIGAPLLGIYLIYRGLKRIFIPPVKIEPDGEPPVIEICGKCGRETCQCK